MLMKQKNKISELSSFICIVGVLFFCTPAFSAGKQLEEESFWSRSDFFFELTPSFLVNTSSKTVSAPNPAFFSIGAGMIYPNDTFFSFEPELSFFWNYYHVYNDIVYPAEIENRTATVLSFLLNVPATFSFNMPANSKLKLSPGTAMLLRIPVVASGVNSTDDGWKGSVQNDVEYMGRWFFENGRFIYLSFKASWIFEHIEKIAFGPVLSVYFPIISVFADKNINGLIFEAGLRIVF